MHCKAAFFGVFLHKHTHKHCWGYLLSNDCFEGGLGEGSGVRAIARGKQDVYCKPCKGGRAHPRAVGASPYWHMNEPIIKFIPNRVQSCL